MPQNDDEPKFTFSHQSADIYVCVCVCVLCVRACVRVGGGASTRAHHGLYMGRR